MSDPSALPTGRFGPPETGGSGRSGPQPWRVVVAVLASLVALLLVAAGTLGSLLLYGQAEMRQIRVGGRQEPGSATVDDDGRRIEETRGVINVLAIGIDSRQGLTQKQLRRLGTNRAGGMNTDTIIVAQLDLDRDEVSLLSFPRDLLVTRCDGSRGRINAAYAVGEQLGRGGPTCLVQTVTQLTGIPIHHYVQVNFDGFLEVVDTLGGVSMWLDEPLQDRYAGIDLPAGCVEMNGATALGYVRSRHAGGRGDFSRMERQQKFLYAVLEEAVSVDTLVNVPQLIDLVGAAARAVETDQDLGINDMRRLAFSMRGVEPESMNLYTVPGHSVRVNGAWMVESHEEQAEELYAAFRRATDVRGDVGAGEHRSTLSPRTPSPEAPSPEASPVSPGSLAPPAGGAATADASDSATHTPATADTDLSGDASPGGAAPDQTAARRSC